MSSWPCLHPGHCLYEYNLLTAFLPSWMGGNDSVFPDFSTTRFMEAEVNA